MANLQDRRSEPRTAAEADGIISLAEPMSTAIRCRLLDTSDHGFRASHDCPDLIAGTQVQMECPLTGNVTARVIWTAIMGDHIESGFYIIS